MTPKAVVDYLEIAWGLTATPRDVRDAIEWVLLENGTSSARAAELTDKLREKVVDEIERRYDDGNDAGEVPVLSLRANGSIVHGTSYVFADDTEAIRQLKLSRTLVDKIFARIRQLTFSEFETFGGRILRELGCTITRVTQHAGDQGIDFYGRLTLGGLINADPAFFRLMHETQVILVGQAKHYPQTSIGPGIVRELIGAMSLSRTKTFSRDDVDIFDEIEIGPFSPVLALLFSTGTFTKGARQLARRAGIVVFSGWQLSVFLADKGVGILSDDRKVSFDAAAFDEWLRQPQRTL